jgi:hypothetical protein
MNMMELHSCCMAYLAFPDCAQPPWHVFHYFVDEAHIINGRISADAHRAAPEGNLHTAHEPAGSKVNSSGMQEEGMGTLSLLCAVD